MKEVAVSRLPKYPTRYGQYVVLREDKDSVDVFPRGSGPTDFDTAEALAQQLVGNYPQQTFVVAHLARRYAATKTTTVTDLTPPVVSLVDSRKA